MLKIKTLIVAIIASVFAFSAMAQTVSMGLTGTVVSYEADGHEKVKSSGTKNTKSEDGAAVIGSIFIELSDFSDYGTVIGIDVMPYGSKIGDGSNARDDTDVNDESDTAGTNKVDVNLANAAMIYVEQPFDADIGIGEPFVKVGYQQLTLETDESLATGSTYGNEKMSGIHVGVGVRGDLPTGGFWKTGLTYASYDGATFNGSNDADSVKNIIELEDFSTVQLSISIGQSF